MRSTGVHLFDDRCAFVVVDHDGVSPRVVEHRLVELPAGAVVAGRVLDAEVVAAHLVDVARAARGHVVATWWPEGALLTTIDCTNCPPALVGGLVDRLVWDRFGTSRAPVVRRKLTVAGRELAIVGACRPGDLHNAYRALQLCGLRRASLIFAPAAMAVFTASLDAPAIIAAGSARVSVVYAFAGFPLVGGALTGDRTDSIVQFLGVRDLSVVQHRSLRPPPAHRSQRVLEYPSTLEAIARDARGDHGPAIHGERTHPLLEAVSTQHFVAMAAALCGTTAVADLVPAELPKMQTAATVGTVPATSVELVHATTANATTPDAPNFPEGVQKPERRTPLLVAAAFVLLVLAGVGLKATLSVNNAADRHDTADRFSAAAVSTTTTAQSSSNTQAPSTTTAVPSSAAQAHRSLYQQGKIYLEGTLPSRASTDTFVAHAAAVVGPENVVDKYVIDAGASRPLSWSLRIDEPLFRAGSDTLNLPYLGILDLGVILMNQHPRAQMTITCHTDSVGDEDQNRLLSVRRANAVVNYMSWRGITRARLDGVGKGETSPIGDNTTEAGRQLNRRVEIELRDLLAD